MSRQAAFSPIDLQRLWQHLVALIDNSARLLRRSAFSDIVREACDFQVSLLSAEGGLLVQSNLGMPSFAFTFQETLRHVRDAYGSLGEGDVVVTNDPWKGTGHLNDITLIAPIYLRGRLVGYVATAAHTIDIGGATSPEAIHDVYGEGLMVPVVKLYDAGRRNEAIVEFLRANVRVPDQVTGDLNAQMAAITNTVHHVQEFLEQHALDDLRALGDEIVRYSEQSLRRRIRESFQGGPYTAEVTTDGFETPHRLRVTIASDGDDLIFDYSGSSPEGKEGVNCPVTFTRAYTVFATKCVLDPDTPNNDGFFRPLRITVPDGSIINCRRGAAVRMRARTGLYLAGLIFQALAPAMPERVMADYMVVWNQTFYWTDPDGRRRAYGTNWNGGLGGRAGSDGLSTMGFPSPVANTPVEIIELNAPVTVLAKALWPGSAGEGRYRGGLGQHVVFRFDAESGSMMVQNERTKSAPKGICGGGDAPLGVLLVNDRRIPGKTRVELKRGDIIHFYQPGGGGYGDPAERDPALRQRDEEMGYVVGAKTAVQDTGEVTA